jgi:hypothetical protein
LEGFNFVGFWEEQCCSPAAKDTPRVQDTDQREACVKIDVEVLLNMWQDAEYWFDVAKATRGAHSELVYD